MPWVDEALWNRDPEDWGPWLVLADRLLEVGDVRGQLLIEESRGVFNEPLAEAWLRSGDRYGPDAQCNLMGVREKLLPLLGASPVAFPRLRPTSHLFAAAGSPVSQHLVDAYYASVWQAVLAWIRHAFADFHMPDEEHRSLSQAMAEDYYQVVDRAADPPPETPWWELPDDYLDEYAAPIFLDEQGWTYYGPALMSLHLRAFLDPEAEELDNSVDSLLYCLESVGPYVDQRWFTGFGEAQSLAVAAYGALLSGPEIWQAWRDRAASLRTTSAASE